MEISFDYPVCLYSEKTTLPKYGSSPNFENLKAYQQLRYHITPNTSHKIDPS